VAGRDLGQTLVVEVRVAAPDWTEGDEGDAAFGTGVQNGRFIALGDMKALPLIRRSLRFGV
jgi:hypothetical protein